MKRTLVLCGLAVMLLAMPATGTDASPDPSPEPYVLAVDVWILNPPDLDILMATACDTQGRIGTTPQCIMYARPAGESACEGVGGYSGLREGAQLRILDESDKVIGVASTWHVQRVIPEGSLKLGNCLLRFGAADIPRAEFYTIDFGNLGRLTYSFDAMVEGDWYLGFTLGHGQ